MNRTWHREGRTIYALDDDGQNRWYFNIQSARLQGSVPEELEAVAALASAAPDLLAACEKALPYLDHSPFENAMVVYDQLRAAIAKATDELGRQLRASLAERGVGGGE